MQNLLVITPLALLVNLNQLVGAQVEAKPFDDPVFKDETYIGVIDQVKLNKRGTFVYFKTPDLVGGKWINLSKITGFAHFAETQKATA